MGVGEAAAFDRLTAAAPGGRHRTAPDRPRREPPGRVLPASLLAGMDVAAAVELVTRGVVEGSAEPGAIYRDGFTSPPALDELTIIVEGGDAAALSARPSGAGSSARAATAPAGCPSDRPTTSARRSSPMRRPTSPAPWPAGRHPGSRESAGCWAWACSWPSAAARPTRPASSPSATARRGDRRQGPVARHGRARAFASTPAASASSPLTGWRR